MNKEKIHIRTSANGMGDSVCASYVAAGASREFEGHEVIFYTKFPDWIAPFVTGFTVKHHNEFATIRKSKYAFNVWNDYRGELTGKDYRKQQKDYKCRKTWLASHVTIDGITPEPKRPTHSSLLLPSPREKVYIVFAPYATHITRMMDLDKVIEIAYKVQEEFDIEVVFLSDNMWAEHAKSTPFKSYIQLPPREVAALLKNAELTLTIDSGIAHFCGLLDAPCLSLVSIFNPDHLYSLTSINTLSPSKEVRGGCRYCQFQPTKGYDLTVCPSRCEALNSISVDSVLDAIDNTICDYRFIRTSHVELWN